jgi:hypothetical protein
MWCSQVWREMNTQIIQINWRMSKVILVDWSADFAMDHEHEKLRMRETTNKLTSPISALDLGSEEMPIEEYVQLEGEEIVDAKHSMVELMGLAWGREVHLGLNLNEDQPTPIVELPQAHEYAQLL